MGQASVCAPILMKVGPSLMRPSRSQPASLDLRSDTRASVMPALP